VAVVSGLFPFTPSLPVHREADDNQNALSDELEMANTVAAEEE